MASGSEGVVKPDLDVPSAEGHGFVEPVCHAGLVPRGPLDQQLGLRVDSGVDEGVRRRVHPGCVLGPLLLGASDSPPAPPQVPDSAPRHPHQEEVQHD